MVSVLKSRCPAGRDRKSLPFEPISFLANVHASPAAQSGFFDGGAYNRDSPVKVVSHNFSG
jgi:hypothetical protein